MSCFFVIFRYNVSHSWVDKIYFSYCFTYLDDFCSSRWFFLYVCPWIVHYTLWQCCLQLTVCIELALWVALSFNGIMFMWVIWPVREDKGFWWAVVHWFISLQSHYHLASFTLASYSTNRLMTRLHHSRLHSFHWKYYNLAIHYVMQSPAVLK